MHHLVAAAGACFGSRMGWERPNVFAPDGADPVIEYSWDAPNWLPWSAAEQRAARRDVALFDQTSFSKYLLTGPDSERALQWLCTADVAVPPGRTVYTGLLNERGCYESDLTVTRVSAEEFLLVSSSATTERDQDHIRRRMPADASARLVNVTSAYAVLGVMGPRSRDLLAALSPADLGDAAFPFGTSREIDLGYFRRARHQDHLRGRAGLGTVRARRVRGRGVRAAHGRGPGVRAGPGGYYTIESMRLEKGYRAFGRELTPEYGPVRGGTAVRVQAAWRRPVPWPGRGGEGPGRGPETAAGFGPGR